MGTELEVEEGPKHMVVLRRLTALSRRLGPVSLTMLGSDFIVEKVIARDYGDIYLVPEKERDAVIYQEVVAPLLRAGFATGSGGKYEVTQAGEKAVETFFTAKRSK